MDETLVIVMECACVEGWMCCSVATDTGFCFTSDICVLGGVHSERWDTSAILSLLTSATSKLCSCRRLHTLGLFWHLFRWCTTLCNDCAGFIFLS